jgi:hypothetical protein
LKERLRNFGVKQPKRGIELGWVTRGTRPKKPSSSRGFAREARGARGTWGSWGSWGSWGLKTENCLVLLHDLQSSFTSQNLTQFYSLTCAVTFRREKEKEGEKKLSIAVLISGPSYVLIGPEKIFY